MTNEEIEKSDPIVSLLAEIQKQNSEAITALTKSNESLTTQNELMSKKFDELSETLTKTTIPGQTMENKPKNGDSKDVGDPVKSPNELAPGQPGPEKTAPLTNESGSDQSGLSMENKALIEQLVSEQISKTKEVEKEEDKKVEKEDDDKKDEKKMEKEEDDKKDDVKKEDVEKEHDDNDMTKSNTNEYEYEVIKAVRTPYLFEKSENPIQANGAQLLKAFRSGFGGKHTDATGSYQEMQKVYRGMGGYD